MAVRFATWVLALLAIALTAAPCVYSFVWAVWGTDIVGVLRGVTAPSFRWITTFFESREWRRALGFSAMLAIISSTATTLLVFLHGYCSRFAAVRTVIILSALGLGVMLFPPIVFGLSYRFAIDHLDAPVLAALFVGHVVLILPIQFIVFDAARETCRTEMLDAARCLGATHLVALRTVYLPNVRIPAFLAWAVGVFFSFDEIVLAVFLLDGPTQTIPRRLWEHANQVNEPIPAVVASLLIAIVAIGTLAWFGIRRLTRPS